MKPLRDLCSVFLAAVFLTLPYQFAGCWIFGFIAFIPLFFALKDKSSGQAFKYSYIFGLIFYGLIGYWLNYVNILGYALLIFYLALYPAFFGTFASYYLRVEGDSARARGAYRIRAIFYVAAFWVLLEVVRGWMISGLPWALLAYSQWRNVIFIQAADWIGAWGISFFVMVINLILFGLAESIFSSRTDAIDVIDESGYRRRYPAMLAGLLLCVSAILVGYGALRLSMADRFYKAKQFKTALRVSVIQGNIPQDQKWDARIKGYIFEKYKRLTFMAAADRTDLIVWPETSFPGYLEDEPLMASQLRSIARNSRAWMLVGAPTLGDLEEGLYSYNSAILYDSAGEESKRYHKIHLVPFGEYIPMDTVLGFIRNFFGIGHFSPGRERTVFKAKSQTQAINYGYKFGVLICYEDIFPDLVRTFVANGADFLVNITNDAWFGNTSAPYQHAQASVFRSVENRVNIIRSTNTGYSCFISPEGRILSSVKDRGREIMVAGYRTDEIVLRKQFSFYRKFGDLFLWIVALLLVSAFLERARTNKYSRL